MFKYYYSDLNEKNVFENDEYKFMIEEIVSDFLFSKEYYDYDLTIEYIHDFDSSYNKTFVFKNMEATLGHFKKDKRDDELFDVIDGAIDIPIYCIKLSDNKNESKYYLTDFYIYNTITKEKEHFYLAPDVICENFSLEWDNDVLRIYRENDDNKKYIFKYKYYTKKDIDDLKFKYGYNQEEPKTNNLVIVDVKIIDEGIMFYFGTKEQFLDNWGDNWSDDPCECNKGIIYTYKWYYVPKNDKIDIIPIEEYLGNYESLYSNVMFKRRIVAPVILSIKHDNCHLLDFPIHFGMSYYELKNLINKLEG